MTEDLNIEPKYVNEKYYDTKKKVKKQNSFARYLIYCLSKISMSKTKYEIEKINMDGLKPPYLLLSNHMYFVDFYINAIATYPYPVNNIATVDGYYRRPGLMEFLGCIPTRKFTSDLSLIKNIKNCVKEYNSIISLYPEARYSPIGTNAILPDSLGKLIKMLDIPVVVFKHHGNYLSTPFWNFKEKRDVPLHTTMTLILTKEDIEKMEHEEITRIVEKEFAYDEYVYQRENNIQIEKRAKGLNKVLYKCPNCMDEHNMDSDDEKLWCDNCKKEWYLNEKGELYCKENVVPEFTHIPSWFEWERDEVRKEILEGKYIFEDEVDVYSLMNPKKFIHLGKAKVKHDSDGIILEGMYNDSMYRVVKTPLSLYGIHIEYDYVYIKPEDCFDISTDKDSFYCYPTKKNVITKLQFAVEELYKIKKNMK